MNASQRKINSSQQPRSSQLLTSCSQSRISRCGRIARMQLKNFMCHANLVIDFNENINIFIGNNGSGKSSILTAIIIGLGGNASAASRSTNIKQLIRRGETSASIEIHLRNDGVDSFDNDIYGSTIIIIRSINASGGSSYKIKDQNGRVQSSSTTVLKQILMYMNIQVDNPICVLNQEASRTFLKDSNDKMLYTLFLKATQIETIINKLDDCSKMYIQAQEQLSVMNKQLQMRKEEYNQIKDNYQKLLSVKSSKIAIKNLKIELAWFYVQEQEKRIEEVQNELKALEINLNKLKEAVQNNAAKFNDLKESKITITDEIKNLRSIHELKNSNISQLKSAFNTQNKELMNHNNNLKYLETKISRNEKEIQHLNEAIQKRSRENVEQIEELKRNNKKKLEEYQIQKEEINQNIQECKNEVTKLKSDTERLENILEEIQNKSRHYNERENRIKSQIRELNAKGSNKATLYGNHMPKLLEIIKQYSDRGLFSETPRGPLGFYIDVPNDKWRSLVERVIGEYLHAFCFNNMKDSQVYDQIIKKEFPNAPTRTKIITKFTHQLYNTTSGMCRPPNNTTLLLNEINVSDPVVTNILIDEINIETILFCEVSKHAEYYTMHAENIPKNLSKILSLEPSAEYYPVPDFRSYGISLHPPRLLQQNLKEYKLQLQEEFASLKEEKKDHEVIVKNNAMNLKKIHDQIQKKYNDASTFQNSVRNIQEQILRIKAIEYPENEVDMLKNELNELNKLSEVNKSKHEKLLSEINTLKSVVNEKEKLLKDNSKELDEFETALEKKEQKLTHIQREFEDFQRNDKFREDEFKKFEINKTKILNKLSSETKTHEELTKKAKLLGERVSSIDRTETDIKDEIKVIERNIKDTTEMNQDIDEVRDMMTVMKAKVDSTEICIKETSNTLKILDESRLKRYRWIRKYKKGISLNVKLVFLRILKIRNFCGDLQINDNEKSLHLNIIPQDKDIANAVSNTKSLSGGERSFSTLAFLLSLWSCVSHPFYFLDEYDVFTDELNRNIMTNLLIREARKRNDRQFCFFSPQDMSFVAEAPDITFHKLADHTTGE